MSYNDNSGCFLFHGLLKLGEIRWQQSFPWKKNLLLLTDRIFKSSMTLKKDWPTLFKNIVRRNSMAIQWQKLPSLHHKKTNSRHLSKWKCFSGTPSNLLPFGIVAKWDLESMNNAEPYFVDVDKFFGHQKQCWKH